MVMSPSPEWSSLQAGAKSAHEQAGVFGEAFFKKLQGTPPF
ncbi:hypothetical protein [Komagataeibacter sp. NFXK3]